MSYQFLADSLVVLHFCFILFVIFGALLILKWRWVVWLHLPCLTWGITIMYIGWICPLTPLENWLRAADNGGGYQGGFIDHYIVAVVYPPGILPWHQIVFGCLLAVFNLYVYYGIWRRRRQCKI